MVYNIKMQSSSFGHCQSCNRYMHTKTLCFGSRLCFRLRAKST